MIQAPSSDSSKAITRAIFRFTYAAQGSLPSQQRFELIVQAAAQLGADGAGGHCVGADSPFAELLGHVAGEYIQATFEGGIRRNARRCNTRRGAGQVDDTGVLLHQRQQRLGEEKRAFEVNVEQTVELRFAHRFKRVEQPVTGVVDQPAQGRYAPSDMQRLHNGVAERSKGAYISNVEFQRYSLATRRFNPLHHRLRRVRVTVVSEDHAMPLASAQLGGTGTDPAAASGNHNDTHGLLHC